MKRARVAMHKLTDAEGKRLRCSHGHCCIKLEAGAEDMVHVTIPKSENPPVTKRVKEEVPDDELEDITVKEEPIDWHQEPQDRMSAASFALTFKKEVDNACAEAPTEQAKAEDQLRDGSSGACNTSAVHQRSAGASQGSTDLLPSDVSGVDSSRPEIPDCSVSQELKMSTWVEESHSHHAEQQPVPVTDYSGPGSSPKVYRNLDTPAAVEQMGISEDGMALTTTSKSDRKYLRQTGQCYYSPNGTSHPAKEFKYLSCKCVFRCDTHLSEDARRELFSRFWELGSWDAQTAFLNSAVSEVPVKRHKHTPMNIQRSKTFHYTVNGLRVCKAVFCSTLGISPKRVTYVSRKKVKEGIVSPDKRGKHVPANKISPEVEEKVSTFLDKFPKYKSHNSDNPKLYFRPDLTHRKMYSLYTEGNPDHPVSLFVFMRELKKYNVGMYLPKKNTCARCDEYRMKNNANLAVEERQNLEKDHKEHITRAELALKELKETEEECRQPSSRLLCFTFDLEKTEPIPYLNNSVAFYKRQMWLYILGVKTRHNKKGHMFVWQEIEGKRGSCEIASSLLTFLQKNHFDNYDEIHTFSDSYGGQNHFKNIVAFFMFICMKTHIKSWTHTFLESGHSYLPNIDFGKIESTKKRNVGIYTLSDWTTIMQMCKFSVTHMKDKFIDVAKLQSYFTFRTVDTQGNKFSWLKLKWLKISQENECLMQYKYSSNPHEELRTIDFSKRNNLSELKTVLLEPLYKEPIKLSFEKFMDLQDLTAYMPSHLVSSFTNLPHEIKSKKSNFECIPDEETEE